MSQSIRLGLRSDVKVGTCLSGGMDSSFIAASAAPIYKQKAKDNFTAITAKSIEKKTDESQYAKEIVDRYNLDWETTKPSKKDFLESEIFCYCCSFCFNRNVGFYQFFRK